LGREDEGDDEMIVFKGCPRCKTGDVVTERDMHGPYAMCLQCGYQAELEDQAAAREARRLMQWVPVPSEAA
jgi:Zn ribbon nucleic-acid-binding protein